MSKVCCVECSSQTLHVCHENLNWEAIKKAWFWCFMKKEDGFFHEIRQNRSLCIIGEVHKLWTGIAGRGEFTIKINKEQLLESPTQGRINGRLCEELDLLAKNH